MAYLSKEALAAAGFTDEITPRVNSAVIVIAGIEGTGKTSWALTAPKPLFYQETDFGTEGVIQKAIGQIIRPKDKDGKPKAYKLDIPHEYRAFVDRKETTQERQQREGRLAEFVHQSFYVPFYEDYAKAIKAGVRSIVWDNAVDIWENVRLSIYGREATNRSDLQAEANAKFREMVRLANVHNVNLIMINHLKTKFDSYYDANGNLKWRPTSDYEMSGFDKSPMLVAMNLWTKFTPGEKPVFELTVKKNRDHPEWVGQTIPAMPFTELMGVLIPEVQSWEE